KLHGYDEFYHGWGAEDTDIHIRMKNEGLEVCFYNEAILVKHQWHSKQYRSKNSIHPFHSNLERINHDYMHLGQRTMRTVVNQQDPWGQLPDTKDYLQLDKNPQIVLQINNSKIAISAVLAQCKNYKQELVSIEIKEVQPLIHFRNTLKKIVRKKYVAYPEMEEVNNVFLEEIIKNYRNNPYEYTFDRKHNFIRLKMFFV
ncbi:galactosyltransferase-related protein, partial [Flavobacterium sp.]|uniref:galactosyltransferase-related protein n=1 Tax=Flavobacterium sp. TaxID=239 RepID=UPI003C522218